MTTATLTSKGQITIPKAVRNALRLRSGDRVQFTLQGRNEAAIRPITKSVDEVFGCLHRPGRRAMSVRDIDRAIVSAVKARR